jgi:regulator of protease activity HflC (stomatin/prohibitin superfamily)
MTYITVGFVIGLLVTLIGVATRCFFNVAEGHVAVVTRFGRALRDGSGRLRTWRPGLHFKAPFDRVHDESAKERLLDLSGESAGTSAMAKDGTVLRFDSHLRYRVPEQGLERWVFGLKRPVEHTIGMFTCVVRNEIAAFSAKSGDDGETGSYSAVLRERRQLNDKIADFVRERASSHYGLEFHGVDLVDVLPPDELAKALNAVMQARSEADAEFARAEAIAKRRELSAHHGVEVARDKAEAAEIELRGLAGFLAELDRHGTLDAYVKRRRAEVVSQSKTLFLGSVP